MKALISTTSLLMTNLRLLDVPDLPLDISIDAETLASGKNKSKVFEHVTHHLFHLYNPAECEAKFQACWPVFEPAQSKAFRAVALSWFSDLKRTGQLPGNTVVRKSTLEDCQGDRYEELMLAFSTLVLRSVLESRKASNSIVYKLATDDYASMEELQPLILAYQSSLSVLLKDRSAEKTQWSMLKSLLSDEDKRLDERPVVEPTGAVPAVAAQEKSTCQRWTANWVTDESLLHNLISGGRDGELNGLFQMGFESAMKATGTNPGATAGPGTSDSRNQASVDSLRISIPAQATRLERWRAHPSQKVKRDGTWKGGPVPSKPNASSKSIGKQVNFERHQNLSVFEASADRTQSHPGDSTNHQTELEMIMGDFEAELNAVAAGVKA